VVYQAGETITVTIDEYVSHSGFIRVAVAGSDQDFVAPTGVDAIDDAYTIYSEPDMNAGGEFDIQVTLPNAPCDPCVMQVIQVMTTSGGDFNGNYFQCADIVIEGAAATGGEETTGGGGSTGGGTTSDSGSASTTSTTSGGSSVSDSGTSTAGSAGSTEGGTATDSGTSGEPLPGESTDDGGCSCRQSPDTTPGWAMLGLLGLLGLRRRR
jgi:MYXO-CTERM domain-containing protein